MSLVNWGIRVVFVRAIPGKIVGGGREALCKKYNQPYNLIFFYPKGPYNLNFVYNQGLHNLNFFYPPFFLLSTSLI